MISPGLPRCIYILLCAVHAAATCCRRVFLLRLRARDLMSIGIGVIGLAGVLSHPYLVSPSFGPPTAAAGGGVAVWVGFT